MTAHHGTRVQRPLVLTVARSFDPLSPPRMAAVCSWYEQYVSLRNH